MTKAEHRRVTEANILLVHFLALCEAVCVRGGSYILEHPWDPGCDPFPSIWCTALITEFEYRVNGRRAHIEQ